MYFLPKIRKKARICGMLEVLSQSNKTRKICKRTSAWKGSYDTVFIYGWPYPLWTNSKDSIKRNNLELINEFGKLQTTNNTQKAIVILYNSNWKLKCKIQYPLSQHQNYEIFKVKYDKRCKRSIQWKIWNIRERKTIKKDIYSVH